MLMSSIACMCVCKWLFIPCKKKLGAVGDHWVALGYDCVCCGAGRWHTGTDVTGIAALACGIACRFQLLPCCLCLLPLELQLHLQLLEL